MQVDIAFGRRPLAGHREPVAQRRSAASAGAVKFGLATSAAESPSVRSVSATGLPSASTSTQAYSTFVPHGPPPGPAAQRRTLARAQHRVRAGIRRGHEARAAGVVAQIERRHPGQRLEHPRRQRAQRVARQVETRPPRSALRSHRASAPRCPGPADPARRRARRARPGRRRRLFRRPASRPSRLCLSRSHAPPALRAPRACGRTPRRSAPRPAAIDLVRRVRRHRMHGRAPPPRRSRRRWSRRRAGCRSPAPRCRRRPCRRRFTV